MRKNLIIYGAGDIGKFIAYNLDLFEGTYNLLGFIDGDPDKVGKQLCGLPVFGEGDSILSENNNLHVVIAISSPPAKISVKKQLELYNVQFPNLIAKNSWISNGVKQGRGILMYPNCTVNYETEIGDFVTINAGCNIGHNVTIGNYANLSPGICLAGFTHIEEGADMGIGCCTRQRVVVGKNSIIGGQAMLISDIEQGRTAVGVPARIIK